MNVYLIVFQKDKQLIYKYSRNLFVTDMINKTNGYGWKVLDVQIYDKNSFVSLATYEKKRVKRFKKRPRYRIEIRFHKI